MINQIHQSSSWLKQKNEHTHNKKEYKQMPKRKPMLETESLQMHLLSKVVTTMAIIV